MFLVPTEVEHISSSITNLRSSHLNYATIQFHQPLFLYSTWKLYCGPKQKWRFRADGEHRQAVSKRLDGASETKAPPFTQRTFISSESVCQPSFKYHQSDKHAPITARIYPKGDFRRWLMCSSFIKTRKDRDSKLQCRGNSNPAWSRRGAHAVGPTTWRFSHIVSRTGLLKMNDQHATWNYCGTNLTRFAIQRSQYDMQISPLRSES